MKSFQFVIAAAMALTSLVAHTATEQKKTLQCEEITVFKLNNNMVDFKFSVFEINLSADSDTEPLYGQFIKNDADGDMTTLTLEEDEDLKGLYQVNYQAGLIKKQQYDVSVQTLLKKSIMVDAKELEDLMTGIKIPDGQKAQLYTLTAPGALYSSPMTGMKTKYFNAVKAYNEKYEKNFPVGKSQPLHVAMSPLMDEGGAKELLPQFKDGEVLIRGMNAFCVEKIEAVKVD